MLFYSTGTPLDLTCISSRALAICWSLFTVITIATYTANLAAHLTVTIPYIPIKNLEELANSAEYIPVVLRGHVLEDIFKVRHLKLFTTLVSCTLNESENFSLIFAAVYSKHLLEFGSDVAFKIAFAQCKTCIVRSPAF